MKQFKRDIPLHMMMMPTVIMLFIFAYIPMIGSIMAFQKYSPTDVYLFSPWVGLDNFKLLFTTPGFPRALRNTISISLMKMVAHLVVPIGFSLLLNEMKNMFVKRMVQTIVYLPHFISWVLMAGIIMNLLSPSTGMVNLILKAIGVEPIFFMGSNAWFQPLLIITDVWTGFGFSTIVYLAALSGCDPTLYEAASIDGAGHWKQMIHVTIPTITPTILLLGTLSLGGILNAGFDQVMNLMSTITMESGDILDTLVYRIGMQSAQFSLATAVGLFKSSISFVLMIVTYQIAYKTTGYRII